MAGVQLFRPFHVGIINFVERRAFFHQTAVTENNVVGGDFRSVGKTGAFVKYKADIFVGQLKLFCNQRVGGGDIVVGNHRQRIHRQGGDLRGGDSLENERIEIVKSAIGRQHHSSAFAGVGIGIVEMLPATAVFGAAVKGDAVGFRRQAPAGKKR